jgi:hypothetical protein
METRQAKPNCEIGPNKCCIDKIGAKSIVFGILNQIYYNMMGGYQWSGYVSLDVLNLLRQFKRSHMLSELRIQWRHPRPSDGKYRLRCKIVIDGFKKECFANLNIKA